MNDQNTDPYIFGDNFFYAVCKKDKLKNLHKGDMVIFGSEFGPKGNVKFYLDTLLVLKKEQASILDNLLYEDTYQESTLKRIGLSKTTNGTMPIHVGKKYSTENTQVFSFFPAKKVGEMSFGRPIIDTESFGLKKPGARTGSKSRQLKFDESLDEIWNQIADSVIQQGYVLGTHANELPIFKSLP